MSASKENTNRADKVARKAEAEAEQALKNKQFMRRTIIAIAVIVVLLVAALIINSDLLYTRTTAVKVGDVEYSPAELSFFFKNTALSVYDNLVNSYGQETADSLLNLSAPLRDQPYSGDQSWADAIQDSAVQEMQRVAVYVNAADKDGYTLSDSGKNTVESSVATMMSYAAANGYRSLDKFLAAYFGKGMDEELFRSLVERSTLAGEYSTNILNSLTYTDDDLMAYYEEHADELDYYDYYSYSLSSSYPVFEDVEDKDAAVHEAAEKLASAKDGAEFVELVHEVLENDANIFLTHNTAKGMSTYVKDWVTDPARVKGDSTVIDTEGSSIAVLYVGKDDNNYKTVDMRHILIKAEEDEDGNTTEEALETAKQRALNLQEQWLKDPTQENFATLAGEFSEDEGSNQGGGLYTAIAKSTMVEGINDFLFNQGSKPSDTAVVYGSNGSYSGYHFVYYVCENRNNRCIISQSLKQQDDFNAKYEELAEGYYNVETLKAVKYANIY